MLRAIVRRRVKCMIIRVNIRVMISWTTDKTNAAAATSRSRYAVCLEGYNDWAKYAKETYWLDTHLFSVRLTFTDFNLFCLLNVAKLGITTDRRAPVKWYDIFYNSLVICPNLYSFQPSHPTASAFIRASTFSLGSIAFGSLIVTILEIIRLLFDVARQSAGQDGNRKYETR